MAEMNHPDGDAGRLEALLGGASDGSVTARLLASASAPAHTRELSGLPDALLAFRAAQPVPTGASRLRVVVGRHPRRALTVVALVAGLSGVTSAAATGSLPRPVQQAAHDALPLLNVPAPAPARPTLSPGTPGPAGVPGPHPRSSNTPRGTETPRPGLPVRPAPTSLATPYEGVPGQGQTPFNSNLPGDRHGLRPGAGSDDSTGQPTARPSATASISPGGPGAPVSGPGAAGSGDDGQRQGGFGSGERASAQPSTQPAEPPTSPAVADDGGGVGGGQPTAEASDDRGHGGQPQPSASAAAGRHDASGHH